MTPLSHSGIARLLLWVYAAPVLGFWAVLSFIPLAGLLMDNVSLIAIVGDALFFLFGFGGLAAAYLLLLCLAPRPMRLRIYGSLRGRVGLASAYATVWLAGYWLFKSSLA